MPVVLNDTWPVIVDTTTSVEELSKNSGLSVDEFLELNPHIEEMPEVPAGVPLNVPINEYKPFIDVFNKRLNKIRQLSPLEWAIEEWEKDIHEYPGPLESNPEIEKYHATTGGVATDDVAWCSSFVNWCVGQSGLKGTGNRVARSWNRWGKIIENPVQGDIVVFKRKNSSWKGHVGFFWKDKGENLEILGGNQTNAVRVSTYPKDGKVYKLLSYRKVSMTN